VRTHNVFIREKDVKRNNEKGFTMVEVAVVLCLFVILVAVSAPGAISFYKSYNFSNDLRTVVSVINTARNKAIQTGAQTVVSFQTNENNHGARVRYVAFVDDGGYDRTGTANDGVLNGTEKILAEVSMHRGLILGPMNINNLLNAGHSIAFNPQGFAMGLIGGVQQLYNGTIPVGYDPLIQNPTAAGITVDLSGFARINKP
jgi:prepilin-type N-terminal cleavage/methylation domain-containing protein